MFFTLELMANCVNTSDVLNDPDSTETICNDTGPLRANNYSKKGNFSKGLYKRLFSFEINSGVYFFVGNIMCLLAISYYINRTNRSRR